MEKVKTDIAFNDLNIENIQKLIDENYNTYKSYSRITSDYRGENGTLIITYEHIDLSRAASIETKQFIKSCNNVSERFKEVFM
jgi:hypothetical protein